MKQVLSKSIAKASLLLLAAGSGLAHAQADRLPSQPNFFTWGELALLPEYCRDTQGVLYQVHGNGADSPRAPYWLSLMGTDFWHMHHYCYALAYMLRAKEPGLTPVQKKYVWQKAIYDLQYVLKNALPTMAVMPEVHLKMAEVQMLMGNIGAAQSYYASSRTLKPDYWPAYTQWADTLFEIKQTDQALALVREGLRYAPDAQELLKRAAKYEAAGGRAPALKKAPAPAAPAASASAGASVSSNVAIAPPAQAEAAK